MARKETVEVHFLCMKCLKGYSSKVTAFGAFAQYRKFEAAGERPSRTCALCDFFGPNMVCDVARCDD